MTTINIHAAVIHELKKEQHTEGDDSVTLVERNSLHESNELLDKFTQKVDYDSRNASRVTSACGSFVQANTLAKTIASYYTQTSSQSLKVEDFLELSKKIVTSLKKQMQDELMATGGYIPILWYTRNDSEYLVIGLVNPSSGFTLDSIGEIIPNTNIDNASLRFSVSIELNIFNQHLSNSLLTNKSSNDTDSILLPNYIRWTRKKRYGGTLFSKFRTN